MKCLNILIAAAALLGCLATSINGATPQDLSVPFNDLLPPLLDTSGAASAVATVAVPAAAPTKAATIRAAKTTAAVAKLSKAATAKKKSRYQEQTQHIKELHLIDDDAVVQRNYKQQQKQLQAAQKLQQQKLTPAKVPKQPIRQKQQKPLPQQHQQQQHRFEQPRQYANYFQQTTVRPLRGALPTLTPFPRHLK